MKIAFIGAGSTQFAKNIIGDCILDRNIGCFDVVLYDINDLRLNESKMLLDHINQKYNGKATITATTDRKEALKNANYVINAIQVGGYDPCTITDFEIPKRYGIQQTIGDTLGIGGIFRALRTIPVMEEIAQDMAKLCPNAWLFNYVNPMAMVTGYLLRYTGIKTVGLCHSVQICASFLLNELNMEDKAEGCKWDIAGINHQAWLLFIRDRNGKDLYPEIKKRALDQSNKYEIENDRVRLEMLKRFGYYVTESSEHAAEYSPYFIKSGYPELIKKYNIHIDEYMRRCILQMDNWVNIRNTILSDENVVHTNSKEYFSHIIQAMETGTPYKVHGNVLNTGLITNLPANACVEVQCLIDQNGVKPCYVGDLPEQCAALNRTSINVQMLTIEAARTRKKEYIYMAAMLDPHTSAELSIDDICSMCDDMIEAHGAWLPKYK